MTVETIPKSVQQWELFGSVFVFSIMRIPAFSRRGVLSGTILALTLALAWLAVREPAYHRIRVESLANLESELEQLRARLRIPGMMTAIARDDRIVWVRGFGMANLERGLPASQDTIYYWASLTKPYASTVLLQLVDEGRASPSIPPYRGSALRWNGVHR